MKKIFNYNEKRKKKNFVQKIEFGLLPNYIARLEIVLQRERDLRAVCIAIQYFVLWLRLV